VREVVKAMENGVIDWLASLRIAAQGDAKAPGVYVDHGSRRAKIAALGLKVRRGCTYHGVAINIAMDLAAFRDIDPCGYPGLVVTDLAAFGIGLDVAAAGSAFAPHLARVLTAQSPRADTTTAMPLAGA
jgi:lipoyl(octanoyl) transferase